MKCLKNRKMFWSVLTLFSAFIVVGGYQNCAEQKANSLGQDRSLAKSSSSLLPSATMHMVNLFLPATVYSCYSNNIAYRRNSLPNEGGDGGSDQPPQGPVVCKDWDVREVGEPESFMRIINLSSRSGTVSVSAIDDSGAEFGPFSLSLKANAVIHFDSYDLEKGNISKGIKGIGNGRGHWRLSLHTDLHIKPLVYTRQGGDIPEDPIVDNPGGPGPDPIVDNPGGPPDPIVDNPGGPDPIVDAEGGGSSSEVNNLIGYAYKSNASLNSINEAHSVTSFESLQIFFFNPSSNWSFQSQLRLINPNNTDVKVSITGRDDEGASAPAVTLILGAGKSRTLTASDLESGPFIRDGDAISVDPNATGRFGDGVGKWRLHISSNNLIYVMNLMKTPSGLSDLSRSQEVQPIAVPVPDPVPGQPSVTN